MSKYCHGLPLYDRACSLAQAHHWTATSFFASTSLSSICVAIFGSSIRMRSFISATKSGPAVSGTKKSGIIFRGVKSVPRRKPPTLKLPSQDVVVYFFNVITKKVCKKDPAKMRGCLSLNLLGRIRCFGRIAEIGLVLRRPAAGGYC
jgi:hypothetical protein